MHTNRGIKKDLEEIIQMTPEEICSDREIFDSLIYTDVDKAIKELHRRREDPDLKKQIVEFLGDIPIPEPLKDEAKVVMFRQVATLNYETSRFLIAADGMGINPLFLEIHSDKFTPENELKKYLLKMLFHTGIGKNSGPKIDTETIADIHDWSGKKFEEITTIWGQSLIDFHHEILNLNHPKVKTNHELYDATNWLSICGGSAKKYYTYVFTLFIANGILLENFMIEEEKENKFVQNVILPSFINVYKEFNLKPLILALEPTAIEGNLFWYCYNEKTKKIVYNKLNKNE